MGGSLAGDAGLGCARGFGWAGDHTAYHPYAARLVDCNEWIWKTVDAAAPHSSLHTVEYDRVEWNLANTCHCAEMSWLIFPRPFMARGHSVSSTGG
ncbi:MAG: hypothetical protein ACKV19_17395 [Verrucomicrobiales bacterium]